MPDSRLIAINKDNAGEYELLCPEHCLPMYRRFSGSKWFYGFGLLADAKPAGMVFGLGNATMSFWLKALQVVSEAAAADYAQLLLEALAVKLKQDGYKEIIAYYTRYADSPAVWLEKELQRFNFSAPRVYKKVYKLPSAGLQQTGLLRLELPEQTEIVPFAALERSHWEFLRSGAIEFTEDLSPFVHEYDPQTSIFLLREGQVAGWNITRRISPHVIYFMTLFICEEYRTSPLGIQLLAESLRRYLADNANEYGIFGARPDNRELFRFIEKRFGRHCTDIAVDYEAIYSL